MRVRMVTWMAAAMYLTVALTQRCGAQVTLAWSPSTSPNLAGYNLCWGTSTGIYLYTNYCLNTQTNFTMSDLATNEIFFFAVQAVGNDGLVSAFSNEAQYTNGFVGVTNALPPSPGTNQSGGGTNGGGTNGGGTNSSTNSYTNITQSAFWGIPPMLAMSVSNGQANLAISATVGAKLMIVASTNDMAMDSWSEVTNVTVSNTASVTETNSPGTVTDLLDVAFVPGTLTVALSPGRSAPFQYFRAIMPYDYIILADQVLPGKGYTPRLIVVNMPGIVCDDACYVNQNSCFIHYSHTNSVLQLIASGATIRNVASALAEWLQLDWTSASEFTWSNGMGQILATVIETEAPSSDPVAGQNAPGPPIQIDF
jgi:hypothetical protein